MNEIIASMMTGSFQLQQAANQRAADMLNAVDIDQLANSETVQNMIGTCLAIRATGLTNSLHLS